MRRPRRALRLGSCSSGFRGSSLPDEDENVVKKLLEAFLTKKQVQALAR